MKSGSKITLTLFLLLTGCSPLPFESTNFSNEEVVGRWILTKESEMTKSYFLQLNSDGTAFGWVPHYRENEFLFRENGTWNLRKDKIELSFGLDHIDYHSLNSGSIEEERVLWDWNGDPDEWQFHVYKKEEVNQAVDTTPASAPR